MKYTLIKADNVHGLINKINKAKGVVIVEGGSDKINRAALENKKVDILLGPERGRKKDHTHYRNSGLNQVLCKLANKNNIAIGFDFNDVLYAKERYNLERYIILGRMMQNVRFCRKYKVKMYVFDFLNERNKEELRSFCFVIGMTPGEAKEAVSLKLNT